MPWYSLPISKHKPNHFLSRKLLLTISSSKLKTKNNPCLLVVTPTPSTIPSKRAFCLEKYMSKVFWNFMVILYMLCLWCDWEWDSLTMKGKPQDVPEEGLCSCEPMDLWFYASAVIVGQETNASMLSFLLAEVGKHPEIEERLGVICNFCPTYVIE